MTQKAQAVAERPKKDATYIYCLTHLQTYIVWPTGYMFGVKYCRRPAMAEVVSATRTKITECLILSGREGWSLHLEVVLDQLFTGSCRWRLLGWQVYVCTCSVHPLVSTHLQCPVSTLWVVIWTAVAPGHYHLTAARDSLAQSPRVAKCTIINVRKQKR